MFYVAQLKATTLRLPKVYEKREREREKLGKVKHSHVLPHGHYLDWSHCHYYTFVCIEGVGV